MPSKKRAIIPSEQPTTQLFNKPFLIGAWAGVGVFVISILNFVISIALSSSSPFSASPGSIAVSIATSIISAVATFLFTYGFYALAVKYQNSLLKKAAVFAIVLLVIGLIFGIAGNFYFQSLSEVVNEYNNAIVGLTEEEAVALTMSTLLPLLIPLFIIGAIFGVAYLVMAFMWAIGLKRLEQVPLARIAGQVKFWSIIAMLVGLPLMVVLIGIPILFAGVLGIIAGTVIEIIVLFQESKTSEE